MASSTPANPNAIKEMAERVRAGERAVLARAITLVESTKPEHQSEAQSLLQELLPATGGALRLGITGVPGVGKSTTIDQLGMNLVDAGHKVAVLAVDPTSRRTGGSILGDKTRMNRLAQTPNAFIRPSPTSGTLGGVTRKTRETMALCEAAGFDVIIVETVGVGQSEVTVRSMVDCFLLLAITGAGDELQGLKRGIMELADAVLINKADGENLPRAEATKRQYELALHYLQPATDEWKTAALTCSAIHGTGIGEVWTMIDEFRRTTTASGAFDTRRRNQTLEWMNALLEEALRARFLGDPAVVARRAQLEAEVLAGRLTAAAAVEALLSR
jgi:LAO/AO transport system kinase